MKGSKRTGIERFRRCEKAAMRLPLMLLALLFCLALQQVWAQDQGDTLLARADYLFAQKRYPDAQAFYQQYVTSYPTGRYAVRATFAIPECLRLNYSIDRNARLNAAIVAYESALAKYPSDPMALSARYRAAVCYVELGFFQDATVHLRTAREQFDAALNDENINNLIADCYYYLEDYDQAIIYYTSFLNHFPESTRFRDIVTRLADSYHQRRNYTRLKELLLPLLEDAPDFFKQKPELTYILAESLIFTGDLAEARKVLVSLLESDSANLLREHIQLRLGDIDRREAEAETETAARVAKLKSAVDFYVTVFRNTLDKEMKSTAALRFTDIADEAVTDFDKEYGLGSLDDILQEILSTNLDPNIRALALTRLARSNYAREHIRLALYYYRDLSEQYRGMEITTVVESEYHRIVRALITGLYEVGNYSSFVDYYLAYGGGLDLSIEERMMVADSYRHVQLNDLAENLYKDLYEYGLDEKLRRRVITGRMEISFSRGDYEATGKMIDELLSMDPTPQERELALFYRHGIYYRNKDLEPLLALYMEQRDVFDTPLLRASILFKLGTLYFIKDNLDEARVYMENLFNQFGNGVLDNRFIYGFIKDGLLTRADLRYRAGKIDEAVVLYERYIFLYSYESEFSWALFQAANCRVQLGQTDLGKAMFEEFTKLYPKNFLVRQVREILKHLERIEASGEGA